MQEEIISVKTAKLAAKKGFNVPCFYSVDGDNNVFELELDFIGNGYTETVLELLDDGEYLAPTQSLLQKWLREEHNLYVMPIFNQGLSEQINCKIFKKAEGDLSECLGAYKGFSSYEEALEVGLFETLRLLYDE